MTTMQTSNTVDASERLDVCFEAQGLNILTAQGHVGVRGLQLRLTIGGQPWTVRYDTFEGDHAIATEPGGRLRVRTTLQLIAGLDGAAMFEHTLQNLTDVPLSVDQIATGRFASSSGLLLGNGHSLGWDFRYCHTDNVRTERYPHCSMEYPWVRMLPVQCVRLGRGEDQPFPAIYFFCQTTGDGLVIGATGQRKTMQSFEIAKAADATRSALETFIIHHELLQTDGLEIAPHASVTLDGTFVQVLSHVHPQRAYEGYLNYLSQKQKFRGPNSPMLTQALHCTWNYGVCDEQYADKLLQTASFIARELPGVKWFLMDDGYCSRPNPDEHQTNFLDRLYPNPDEAVDKKKFPLGMRHYSDSVRALGLRPGIWWSPTTRVDSLLFREHPDWFLRDKSGAPFTLGGTNGYLDLTVPAARDFLDRTVAHMARNWRFDAMKIDFWSQQFESRNAQLAHRGINAVQLREMLFEIVHKHLPEDGVIITCVATGMGNPFVGEYADAYRNTIDIGSGKWHRHIQNCAWALPTLLNPGRQTFLLDQDSAGINLANSDNENYFRLTWCWITMGMQEIGGRLEQLPDKWVKAMRRFTDRCDRGYAVRCADENAFTGVPLPECLYVDFPDESPTRKLGIRQSIALFNWTDEPRQVSVFRAKLGHVGPVRVRDFWTDQTRQLDGEFLSQRLAAHSALLLDVI